MSKKVKYMMQYIKDVFKQFKNGTTQMFKEFFNKDTNKKQRANMWTFIRLIIPIITIISSVCAIAISSPVLFAMTGLIAGFGAVTDYFDGKSSRKHNSVSEYGKLLDQVSDKVFAGIVGINLLFININYLFILLGELLIASVNIGYKINYKDLNISSTKMGKIKEWPLFITLALGFLSPINATLLTVSNISIILTTIFQILTTASYIETNSKAAKELEREQFVERIDVLVQEENKKEKELELTKQNSKTKLEQYRDLRNVLNEILTLKSQNTDNVELENYQKTKEL